jgi:hypothetical protein
MSSVNGIHAMNGYLRFGLDRLCIGIIAFSFLTNAAAGQTTTATSQQTTLQTFRQEQLALGQEMQALVAQGATPAQLAAWQRQNAARFQAQTARAQQLSAAAQAQPQAQPLPLLSSINIPANASPALENVLIAEAQVYNEMAQARNQQSQSGTAPQGPTNLFQQRNDLASQNERQLAASLKTEFEHTSVPIPPPLNLPSNTPPKVKNLMVLRDALMREEIQLWNQNINSNPATRDAALHQWLQQNATRLQQAQKLAIDLTTQTKIEGNE